MDKNKLTQFAKIMNVLGELYNKEISETLLELYWRVLKQYSVEVIKKAVFSHINHEKDGTFMPKPADIIRHISLEKKEKALKAWTKVDDAIRRIGRYGCVAFDDQVIHLVIKKMGGWSRMCSYTTSQMPAIVKAFIENYAFIAGETSIQLPPYVGSIDYGGRVINIK